MPEDDRPKYAHAIGVHFAQACAFVVTPPTQGTLQVADYAQAEKYLLIAGDARRAMLMYNEAGRYADAKRLATSVQGNSAADNDLMQEANELETKGKYAQAEQLYIAAGAPNKAMAMYRNAALWDDLIRLVEQLHPEHVQDTHIHVAQQLDKNGELKEAEKHYLLGGEWKSAAAMYRNAQQWESAHRLAKAHGGEQAAKQVAVLWARSLGGDSAVKLLQKFGLLEEAIDYAAQNGAFDFAFELCRLGAKHKAPEVHARYAVVLEDEGRGEEAEQHYLLGNRPQEAVHMYVHQQDWNSALRVAEKHCTQLLPDIYVGLARQAFQQRDFTTAERHLLRAQKPEAIVQTYRDMGMWEDALRVARDYVPSMLSALESEYATVQLKAGARGAHSFAQQARDYQERGEYDKAVACLLKVRPPLTDDKQLQLQCWQRAGEIALKFLPEEVAAPAINELVQLYVDTGESVAGAELQLAAGNAEGAVHTLMAANEWARAKKVADELAPELRSRVDEQYKDHLKRTGDTDELAAVDVQSAIDEHILRGDWNRALRVAAEAENSSLLHKYVTMCATTRLRDGDIGGALGVLREFGAPPLAHALYEDLAAALFGMRDTKYEHWAAMRNSMLQVVDSPGAKHIDSDVGERFATYMLVAHFYALQSALRDATNDQASKALAAKLAVSQLRYTDVLNADRAFYEAGMACR